MDKESQIQADQAVEDDELGSVNSGAVGVSRPKRSTKRTEKGKSYIAHIRWTDCYSLQKKVSRQIDQIVSSTENAENVDVVENILAAFRITCEELKLAVAALLSDLETDEELNVANDWYAEQYSRANNIIETTEQWISSAKNKIEDSLESRSTSTRHTGSSRRSKASSSKSSIASGRAKEKAKAAELKAKVALLERKQELEQKAERLRLEEQLAVAEARERAYAEIENGAMGEELSTSNVPSVQPKVPQPESYPQLNPLVPEFHIKPNAAQSASNGFQEVFIQQNKLTEMLVEQHQQSLLPSLQITKFAGDPLEYSSFVTSFESQIESKLRSNDVCLRYLEQYLEGEPKELIKGCLHLDEQSGYPEAKKLLREKYGDPYKICNGYIKKFNEWPCIRLGDDLALDRFCTFLTQCRSAMTSLAFLTVLDHPHNLQSLVKKLPLPLQDRWRREANKLRLSRETIPAFADFVSFVKTEVGIAMDPIFSREALNRVVEPDRSRKDKYINKPKVAGDRLRPSSYVSSHATAIDTNTRITAETNLVCQLCRKVHDLDDCQEYLKKNIQERREFLKEKGFCFACYGTGHRSSGCARRRTCKTCSRRHPTGLHDETFQLNRTAAKQQSSAKTSMNDQTNEAVCHVVGTGTAITAVPIVPVKLKAAGSEVLTYAMLDTCSTGTFILEDVAASLGLSGVDTKLMIKTVNGSELLDTKALNGLIASDLNGNNSIHLPKTFTKEDITAVEEDVPTPELAQRWSHLKRIEEELPPRLPGAKVGLLIGSNCPKALERVDVVASENGGPFAVKTFAGWAIVGPLNMCNKEHSTVNCNRIATKEIGSKRLFDHHFMVEDRVKEIVTPQALNEMFELDFSERSKGKELEHSQEDRKFLQMVNEGVTRTDDGHYEIPLPLRLRNVRFPGNREQVLHRAYRLKKKLNRNSAFMQTMSILRTTS